MLAPLSLHPQRSQAVHVRRVLRGRCCSRLAAWAERSPNRRSLVWLAVVGASRRAVQLDRAVRDGRGVRRIARVGGDRRVRAGASSRSWSSARVTGAVLAAYFLGRGRPEPQPQAPRLLGAATTSPARLHTWCTRPGTAWSGSTRRSRCPRAVFVVLFVFGMVVLVRLRARVVAVAMPFLWLEMALMAGCERYPFLDLRTSQFLLVSSLVVVALGAVGLVGDGPAPGSPGATSIGGLRRGRRRGRRCSRSLFVVGFHAYIRELNIPAEDVRAETRGRASVRTRADVVAREQVGQLRLLVLLAARRTCVSPRTTPARAFGARSPDSTRSTCPPAPTHDIARVVARGRGSAGAAPAPAAASTSCATHLSSVEEASWRQAFDAARTCTPRVVGRWSTRCSWSIRSARHADERSHEAGFLRGWHRP